MPARPPRRPRSRSGPTPASGRYGDDGPARDRGGLRRRPARSRANPRTRTARPPRRCRERRRARRRATRLASRTSLRAARARTGSPPLAATAYTAGAGLTSASALMSAQNAIRFPSGDHATPSTDQSPRVMRRTRAPARAGWTKRCAWRSRNCSPSWRQSARVIARASGSSPLRRGPTAKRASGAAAASASRLPSGEGANAETPCGSAVSCSASPPSAGTAQTCSSRRKSDAVAGELRRGVAHVAGRERTRPPTLERGEPHVSPVRRGVRDAPRIGGVRAVGGDGRVAERDLAQHEPAKRRRHPAGQHTAGHQPDRRDPASALRPALALGTPGRARCGMSRGRRDLVGPAAGAAALQRRSARR